MNSPLFPMAACLGALGLVLAGGWVLCRAPSPLERAVASLTLSEEAATVTELELKRPRERHRAERARRPPQRPSRPVTYDW